MTFGQFLFDAWLARQQPVHRLVEFAFLSGIEMEKIAEAAVECVGVESTSGGKFGGRIEDTGGDHSNDEIARAAGKRIEDGIQMEIAQGAEHGSHMAMRERAGDEERVRQCSAGGGQGAGQSESESIDLMGWEMGKVCEGAGLDLTVVAVGFAEEDGGRGVTVGYGGDVHAYRISPNKGNSKGAISSYMPTLYCQKLNYLNESKRVHPIGRKNFGLGERSPGIHHDRLQAL